MKNDTLATHLHVYPPNQHAPNSDAAHLPLGVFALFCAGEGNHRGDV